MAIGNKKLMDHAYGQEGDSKKVPVDEKKKVPVQHIGKINNATETNQDPPASAPAPMMKKRKTTDPEDNNYEMSPPREDSEDEDSEEEERQAKKKKVPRWASKVELAPALERQRHIDPDKIFPMHANTCDLDSIFPSRKGANFGRRGESGVWTKDGLQMEEIERYRRAQRYNN